MIEVREATENDNQALLELQKKCPMGTSIVFLADSSPDYFGRSRPYDDWKVLVATEDGKIVGSAGYAKIQGSKDEWDSLDEKIESVGTLRREDRLNLISNLTDDCIRTANDEKRSLGIVKPTIEERYFSDTADYDPSIQVTLFGSPLPKSKSQYPKIPRIKFRCSNCKAEKSHDMTVLEWGFYEWFRKNPDNIEQAWENALMDSPDHEIFFLLGNLLRYRNAFLIISVLRLPKGSVIAKPLIPFKK